MNRFVVVAVLMAALVTLLISVSLVVTTRGYPKQLRDSITIWARGAAWLPLAWVMVGAGRVWENPAAVVLGSVLFALAPVDYARALRHFFADRRRRVLPWALLGAVAVGAACFAYVWPSYRARVVATSTLLAALQALVAQAALAGRERPRPPSHWLTAIVFVLGAALLLARAVYDLLQPETGAALFSDSVAQVALFVVSALLPLVAAFGFVLMCNDRFNQELLRLASYDPLTGAFNRRSCEEYAQRAVAEARSTGRPLAALLLDVDHFKRINDEFGHAAGDKALQTLAVQLRRAAPQSAVLGRMGGEEFLLLLPDTDAAAARESAEQLRAAVSEAGFQIGERRLPMTVSIGVASLAPDVADFDALSARADHAMYRAKHGGRDRVEVG